MIRKTLNITLFLLDLLIPAAVLTSARNLLAPEALCWIPAGRAALMGAVGTMLLLIEAYGKGNALEDKKEKPRSGTGAY